MTPPAHSAQEYVGGLLGVLGWPGTPAKPLGHIDIARIDLDELAEAHNLISEWLEWLEVEVARVTANAEDAKEDLSDLIDEYLPKAQGTNKDARLAWVRRENPDVKEKLHKCRELEREEAFLKARLRGLYQRSKAVAEVYLARNKVFARSR